MPLTQTFKNPGSVLIVLAIQVLKLLSKEIRAILILKLIKNLINPNLLPRITSGEYQTSEKVSKISSSNIRT